MFSLAKCVKGSNERVEIIMDACRNLTAKEYMDKSGRLVELKAEWVKYWQTNDLDMLICPGFAIQAPEVESFPSTTLSACYTFVWNVLAMCAVSLPVTVVRQNEIEYQSQWEDDITKGVREAIKGTEGMPINVQVVGFPF